MVRISYHFSGRVQGVGFRYRCYKIAVELGLTGWVRNLVDGRVEMEVQGDLEKIQEMIKKLSLSAWIRMDRVNSQKIDLVREEKIFQVVG